MAQDHRTWELDLVRGGVMYTLNITEIHCVAYCTNDDSTKESDDCV